MDIVKVGIIGLSGWGGVPSESMQLAYGLQDRSCLRHSDECCASVCILFLRAPPVYGQCGKF